MTRSLFRCCALSLLAGLSLFGTACGGGGGSAPPVVNPPAMGVMFTPAIATPGANTVSLGNAVAAGTNITVDVQITDTDDFFGTTFTLAFNPAQVSFVSATTSASVIEEAGVTTQIDAVPGASAGTVVITATRFNAAGNYVGGVDVTGTSRVLSLTFNVPNPVANSALTISGFEASTCNDTTQTCCNVLTDNCSAGFTSGAGSLTAN